MKSPTVSIIVPAYNGAHVLGEAIQSVFNQTYPHLELIIVNDVSPDNTDDVIKQFDDPRLKYIVHKYNQGPDKARKTGLNASTGEIVIFLDQDDLLHPEKLQEHVAFLENHPEIGITYNAHFEFTDSIETTWDIWRPQLTVTLVDLVSGYPFAPSDAVFRREWAFREEIWEDSFVLHGDEVIDNGSEIIVFGRLYLAGCKFACINRAFNYRRYHSGRVHSDLAKRCRAELACQEIIFADPRCPEEVLALQNIAFMNIYLMYAYDAFVQDEFGLAQEFIREASHLNPSILEGQPCRLINVLVTSSIDDKTADHEEVLKKIFTHLPSNITWSPEEHRQAIAQGHLLKGVQAIMWNRSEDGNHHFERAKKLEPRINETFLQALSGQLISYEQEFGFEATRTILDKLTPCIKKLSPSDSARRLTRYYYVNRAFQSYENGDYERVPGQTMRAIFANPRYLVNRGMLSILFRSALHG